MQISTLDDVWRNHIEDIAQRTQQHALFEEKGIKARPHLRQVARIYGPEF
jgi:hypothetical protein